MTPSPEAGHIIRVLSHLSEIFPGAQVHIVAVGPDPDQVFHAGEADAAQLVSDLQGMLAGEHATRTVDLNPPTTEPT
jgi:hypothetical protein